MFTISLFIDYCEVTIIIVVLPGGLSAAAGAQARGNLPFRPGPPAGGDGRPPPHRKLRTPLHVQAEEAVLRPTRGTVHLQRHVREDHAHWLFDRCYGPREGLTPPTSKALVVMLQTVCWSDIV